MALDALRCNHLAPLGFKGLNFERIVYEISMDTFDWGTTFYRLSDLWDKSVSWCTCIFKLHQSLCCCRPGILHLCKWIYIRSDIWHSDTNNEITIRKFV